MKELVVPALVQGGVGYLAPALDPAIGQGAAGVVDFVLKERAGGKALISGAVGGYLGRWARGSTRTSQSEVIS